MIHFEQIIGWPVYLHLCSCLSCFALSTGAATGSSHSDSSTSICDSVNVFAHDYSDFLYLHPSDSSNTALITCVLTRCENYVIWSKPMKFSLSGKNKLNFIEGLVLVPIEP